MSLSAMVGRKRVSWFSTHTKRILGLIIVCLICASCRAIIDSTEDKNYLTPVPRATLDAFQYDQPIETKLQAVITSQRQIETTHINWLESPQVIFVKRMFYKEVIERLEESESETYHDPISPEVSVWLVVFKGKMSITQPLGKTTEPGNLCVFAIINSRNGEGYRYGSRNCSTINLKR